MRIKIKSNNKLFPIYPFCGGPMGASKGINPEGYPFIKFHSSTKSWITFTQLSVRVREAYQNLNPMDIYSETLNSKSQNSKPQTPNSKLPNPFLPNP